MGFLAAARLICCCCCSLFACVRGPKFAFQQLNKCLFRGKSDELSSSRLSKLGPHTHAHLHILTPGYRYRFYKLHLPRGNELFAKRLLSAKLCEDLMGDFQDFTSASNASCNSLQLFVCVRVCVVSSSKAFDYSSKLVCIQLQQRRNLLHSYSPFNTQIKHKQPFLCFILFIHYFL